MRGHSGDNVAGLSRKAFGDAYQAYAGIVYGIACRLAPDKTVAEQILSDVFLSLYQDNALSGQTAFNGCGLFATIFRCAAIVLRVHFSGAEAEQRIASEQARLRGYMKA